MGILLSKGPTKSLKELLGKSKEGICPQKMERHVLQQVIRPFVTCKFSDLGSAG